MNKLAEQLLEDSSEDSITMYHGGRALYLRDPIRPSRTGRWEYGPGLYLTSSYLQARQYAKGGGRVYEVTFSKKRPIDGVRIDLQEAIRFVKDYVKVSLRPTIIGDLKRSFDRRGFLEVEALMNLCVTDKALTPRNTVRLRELIVKCGADYALYRSCNTTIAVIFNEHAILKIRPARDVPVDQYDLAV